MTCAATRFWRDGHESLRCGRSGSRPLAQNDLDRIGRTPSTFEPVK